MIETAIKKNNFFSQKKILFILFVIEIPILSYLIYYYSPYIFLFPIILIFGIIFYFTLINFEFWILTSIISFAPLIAIKSEGITIFEIAIAFYIFIPLALWLIKKLFIEKERINKNISDFFLFLFYFICLSSIILTIINNFSVLLWFKEIIVFSCYFIFFPLREYLTENKYRIKKVLISFGIMSTIIALYNLYQYRSRLALATQFYQVWGSRVGTTEQVFMFCILVIIAIVFLIKSKKIKSILLLLVGLFLTSLILSFTRSYLIFTILGIIYLWFLFEKKDKIKVSIWVTIFLIISFFTMFILFDNLSKFIFQALINRFLTAKSNDISIIQRVIETEAIIKQIFQNPILGWGLGAAFRRYDLFFELHIMSYYAHNGYLYLWYKLGILGLLSFLSFYFLKLMIIIKSIRIEENPLLKKILQAFLFILISFLIISITSPQFYHKPSILIMSIIWAFGDSVYINHFNPSTHIENEG
ncbi:MAG TPA: O-antigen ligase family protein [Ignavibacteria bacterium]